MRNMFEVIMCNFEAKYFFAYDYKIESGDLVWIDEDDCEKGRIPESKWNAVIQCCEYAPVEENHEAPTAAEAYNAVDILEEYFENHGAARVMLTAIGDFI